MSNLREIRYFYKTCIFDENMNEVDKKRYFHYCRLGFNFGNSNKREVLLDESYNSSKKHIRK